MWPVKRGSSAPNSAVRTAERTPSAPTIRSASNSVPSLKVATAVAFSWRTPVQLTPKLGTSSGMPDARILCRSARWMWMNGASYSTGRLSISGVRKFSRPERQLRPTSACGRKPTASMRSSNPRAFITLTAFGVIWIPAPTSPKPLGPFKQPHLKTALDQAGRQRHAANTTANDAYSPSGFHHSLRCFRQ